MRTSLTVLLGVTCLSAHAAPLDRDVAAYARSYGISHGEAVRQLTVQEAVLQQQLGSRLGAAFPESYAGAFIQHVPDYRIVVRTTDGRADLILPYVSDATVASSMQVIRARHPLAKLHGTMDRLAKLISKHGVDADLDIDIERNRVEVLATSATAAEKAWRGSRARKMTMWSRASCSPRVPSRPSVAANG